MGVPGSVNGLLGAAVGAYQVSRSLRFNSADSAYLNRTPASAGNRKTWTWSGWVKRSKLGTSQTLFRGGAGTTNGTYVSLYFRTDDAIDFGGWTSNFVRTSAVFRDCSAWYHIVLAVDTTLSSNRIRLYVNGTEQTVTQGAGYPAQNDDLGVNQAALHTIGGNDAAGGYSDLYLADIWFLDGIAATPSDFAETDATTGQWIPKTYTGSKGTNGFHLEFADNSNNTASTLGKDTSGNSNNWTPSTTISVTAGAGNDSLTDTPTSYGTDAQNGGEVRGNYCTWNPLGAGTNIALSNGNLDATSNANDWRQIKGTIGVTSGKWYWECTNTGTSGTFNQYHGISNDLESPATNLGTISGYCYGHGGDKYAAGVNTSGAGASYGTNDVIGMALDLDSGTQTIKFYKNGTLQFTQTISGSAPWYPASNCYYSQTGPIFVSNFGQRAFAYTAPSGFKALCDTNLTEGSITTSGTFTGNASSDGPFVWLNGVPTAMTINSNAVTFGTHADKLGNGFKVRSSSGSYNTAGSNTYSITTTGAKFKYARAQANP